MGAVYWISKGLSVHKAIDKVRKTNPLTVEVPEQEGSLYKLQESLKNKDN